MKRRIRTVKVSVPRMKKTAKSEAFNLEYWPEVKCKKSEKTLGAS